MFQKLLSSLSPNSKKVLAALLNHNEPVSAQNIADLLDLSIYQVRYSVKKIQACLVFKNIEIQQKPNEGIWIIVDEQERKELLAAIQNSNDNFIALNSSDRLMLLLQIILTAPDKLKQQDIRNLMYTSSTSFYRDLEKARKWLASFSLNVLSKRNAPMGLEGPELKIRNAILEILLKNLGQNFLLQACILPFEDIEFCDYGKSVFIYQCQEYIERLNLPECEKSIRYLERKYQGNLFDQVHIELTLYLGVMASRIRQGKTVREETAAAVDVSEVYSQDALGILQDLLPDVEPAALSQECAYLAYLFSQCFQHGTFDTNSEGIQKRQKGENHELARVVVKEIAKYLHAGLYEDKELTDCIEWELVYCLRNKDIYGLKAAAPSNHCSVQSTTEQTLFKILKPILVKEGIVNTDEIIKAISNHTLAALERVRATSLQRRVLLVCGSGVATAFSLKSQLNTQLPEIDVTEMVSVFELAHNFGLTEDCDAIISTIPLGNITSIPKIHVNALLTEEDIVNIRSTLGLDAFATVSLQIDGQINFREIVNKHTIQAQVPALQPAEVIEKVGGLLLGVNAIWPSYIKAMKNLYSLYGPYMVIAPNTALLHAGPEMGSKKLAISLITLKEPIRFGHNVFDPVRIAMAFSSPVNSVHTNALSSVFNFFAVPENREQIINARSTEELLTILLQPTFDCHPV